MNEVEVVFLDGLNGSTGQGWAAPQLVVGFDDDLFHKEALLPEPGDCDLLLRAVSVAPDDHR